MAHLIDSLNSFLTGRLGIENRIADFTDDIIAVTLLIAIGFGLNWACQGMFRVISKHSNRLIHSKWHNYIVRRRLGHHLIMLIPGIVIYFLLYSIFGSESTILQLLHRVDIVYMIVVMMLIANATLLAFLDFYTTTEKSRNRPLQGLIQGLQIVIFFIGTIICVAVLIDKSPVVLLTGLGASAAVLMLIFKDSILGFVAGVQLMQNDMVKLGDWIQMNDGSANGVVEEINLNTIKIRNWDNTVTTIPPYTFVSTPVKNWRGMQESGGRRVDKRLFIDMKTIRICTAEQMAQIVRDIPLMAGLEPDLRQASASAGQTDTEIKPADRNTSRQTSTSITDTGVTNSQLFRTYIRLYLQSHPGVNKTLDLIVAQREPTQSGLPIEVYFFLKDKVWDEFETIQSDIFDHLIAMAPSFGLELYQLPSKI